MTCVAWDGKTLAADRAITFGRMRASTTKLRRIGEYLVGGAGYANRVQEMMAWIEGGMSPEDFPEMEDYPEILLVAADGSIQIIEDNKHPVRILDPYFAVGTGQHYAMAAMYLGCDAIEAVKVASHFDSECGCGVDTLSHGQDA